MLRGFLQAVALIALCGPAGATISVTPGAVSYVLHAGPSVPTSRNFLPQKNRVLTVTSTSAWTVAQGGTLSNLCRFGDHCYSLSGEFDGVRITSGSGGTTRVWLNWQIDDYVTWVSPGTYSGFLTFTETATGLTAQATVTIAITDNTVSVAVTDTKATSFTAPGGCTNQANTYPSAPPGGVGATGTFTYANICPITNEAPGVLPSLVQPAVGATYVDPDFGGTVRRITAAGGTYEYGNLSPFTSGDTYVVATTGVYKTADSTLFRAQSNYGWNIAKTYPSPIDDSVLYGATGSLLQKYNIATNTLTTLVDYNAAPYWMRGIYAGGESGMSEDGWMSFYDNGSGPNSFSTLTNGTGSKTFTITSGSYSVGTPLTLTCGGGGCDGSTMAGLVTAATGTSITVNFTTATGTFAGSVWSVNRTYPYICAVNVYQIDTTDHAASNSNTYCASWSPTQSPGILISPSIDWLQTFDIDRPTGNRYIWMAGYVYQPASGGFTGGNTVFRVGTAGSGQLVQDYVLPETPSRLVNNDNGIIETGELGMSSQAYTHTAGCIDTDGQAWMFGVVQYTPATDVLTMVRVSAGKDLMLPVEAGGGLKMMAVSNWDTQPGCSSRAHMWSYAPLPRYDNPDTHRYATQIASASYSASGNVVTLTLAPIGSAVTIPWSGTRPVLIANITGSWAPLNGISTSTFISNTSLSVVCAACASSSGALNAEAFLGDASATPLAATKGDRNVIYAIKPGEQTQRIAMVRSVDWMDITGLPGYYGLSTVGSISRSGVWVGFNSNYGGLDFAGPSSYIAATGLDYLAITNMSAQPGETTAVLGYDLKLPSVSCTLDLSTDSAFQTGITHPTDPGGTTTRRIPLSGLTAAKNYWVRTQCGNDVKGTKFTTLPAGGAATKTVTSQLGNPSITGMAKVVPEHRKAGSSTWIADSAVACASGCSAAWTGDVGYANEFHFLWEDGGSTILQTSPTYSMMVSR